MKLTTIFVTMLIIMLPICFADSISLTYDANGNLVGGDGLYREYNSLNQLVRVRNDSGSGIILEEFTHHPTSERILVKKVYNNDTSLKETVYYVSEEFVRVVNSSGSFDYTYVKHEGQLVGQEVGGTKHYIHGDHIGSATVVTNQSGDVIENTTYSPFGSIVEGGETTRYSYEGKEFDSVVGDYDFNFRKYKAAWGIFLQPDTMIQDLYDPQTLNRYSFERNNPYNKIDEDGHFFLEALLVIGIVSIVVAGAVMIHKIVTDQATTQDRLIFYGGALASIAPGGASGTVAALKGTKDVGGLVLDTKYIADQEKEEDEEDEEKFLVIKVDTTDTDVNLVTYSWLSKDEASKTYSSLSSSGWTPVLDDEGEVDYWCIGSGCPGSGGGDEDSDDDDDDEDST